MHEEPLDLVQVKADSTRTNLDGVKQASRRIPADGARVTLPDFGGLPFGAWSRTVCAASRPEYGVTPFRGCLKYCLYELRLLCHVCPFLRLQFALHGGQLMTLCGGCL